MEKTFAEQKEISSMLFEDLVKSKVLNKISEPELLKLVDICNKILDTAKQLQKSNFSFQESDQSFTSGKAGGMIL